MFAEGSACGHPSRRPVARAKFAPLDKQKPVLSPLQSVEIRQIVEILRAVLILAAELALLLHRQAVHRAAADGTFRKCGRWIVEVSAP